MSQPKPEVVHVSIGRGSSDLYIHKTKEQYDEERKWATLDYLGEYVPRYGWNVGTIGLDPVAAVHQKLTKDGDVVTIPRDLHELYKEGAEKWAKEQVDPGNGWSYNNEHCCWTCMDCYEPLEHWDKSPTVHAADCKAARILGLKREVAE